MKTALWLAIYALVFLAGYNIGLQAGRLTCQTQIEQYQHLYYQAITWQDWEQSNLPHITKAIGLKEKEK